MASDLQQRIVQEAISWEGTPWQKATRVKGRGADCLNFCAGVFQNVGVLKEVPTREYPYRWWQDPEADLVTEGVLEGIQHLHDGYGCLIVPEGLEPGALVTVGQLPRDPRATHAVLIEEVLPHSIRIIHARQGAGGRIQRTRMPPNWHIVNIFLIRGG